jgi:hypothetical protein
MTVDRLQVPTLNEDYHHKRDVDYLLPAQKFGERNTHEGLTPAEIVEQHSSPGLRQNELTPRQYRDKRLAERTWTETDEAAYQFVQKVRAEIKADQEVAVMKAAFGVFIEPDQ